MNNRKARAWDRKEEKWLGVNLQMSLFDGMLWWQFGYGCEPLSREERDEIDLMWSTGLTDTTEQEIFEKDIVTHTFFVKHKTKNDRISNRKPKYEWESHTDTAIVEWGRYDDGEYVSAVECWMFDVTPLSEILYRVKTHRITVDPFKFKNDSLKIIGNVYENPEIMKENK